MIDEGIPFYTVDAFANRAFSGNPAAVCMDADGISDTGRQQIAREMNLSETAFVYRPGAAGARRLRWFTPVAEVPLCGHATLASAHVLIRELGVPPPVRFESASGVLTVRKSGGRLVMDFPANPASAAPVPDGLTEALGLGSAEGAPTEDAPGEEARPIFAASSKVAIVVLPSEAAVLAVRPDFGALAGVALPDGVMGVAVTARGSDPSVDFVSRFFAPRLGVDEDPVTGVAHTTLAPWWATVLNKPEMSVRQRSARGGKLGVRVSGDRVELAGHAVTVARGTMVRPA